MIIRQVKINRFGKLADEEIRFAGGLNIVYGPNESGKSTLQGFLLHMLFGMNRSRGKASKTDAFARFEPVTEPLQYAGSMTFEADGRTWHLNRSFAAGKRGDLLVCADDGEVLSADGGDLAALLGGISRQTYESTQSVSGTERADTVFLQNALRDRYAHLAAEGEPGVALTEAIENLKRKQKQAEAEERRQKRETQEKISRIAAQLELVRTETEKNRRELAQAEEEKKRLEVSVRQAQEEKRRREEDRRRNEEDRRRDEEDRRRRQDLPRDSVYADLLSGQARAASARNAGIFFAAAAVLVLLLMVLAGWRNLPWVLLFMGFTAASFLSFVLYARRRAAVKRAGQRVSEEDYRKKEVRNDRFSAEDRDADFPGEERTQEEPDFSGRMEALSWQASYLQSALREQEETKNRLQAQYEAAVTGQGTDAAAKDRAAGLQLAVSTLEELSGAAREKADQVFRKKAEQNYLYLTGQTDHHLFLEQGEPGIRKGTDRFPFWKCSKGTQDLLMLSLRLAAADLLLDAEAMPVLLDDAFVSFDDDRLKRALMFLANKKRQVILFTCHMREIQMLEEMTLRYHRVAWSGDAGI